ncbi:glycosyltransferase [Flavobacterium aquicola]|uniref:N-acetylgalactosamine-N, N'-diacetylbacillosaminyl-diphospho-undecaprenol 4-alpha-N-acetylgalactosaminyltransferase n=1 Tax=Flavobacterium aquicola TaxID=1682742 RepID=A0A3E0EJZ5_9FLAO|nr:glycosyltransferase [Flavobacterium aquicola]REG98465.1 N-acetylgalactosamine-N,N'-diacetylbacillosaminyl-diphospho-undecaprenol 4-alpha-N-acetylgalactosaminyltransferase [Flavobacterium aquicola]
MTLPKKRYKIALIGYRLTEGGGEKVMANLSLFFEKKGIEVHNIIVLDGVTYPYSGKLVNMGLLKNESNGFLNKLKRLLFFKNHLKENNFDFIIDFRPRTKLLQEIFIAKFIYNTKTIFTVHSFLIDYYMPKNYWLTRLIYKKIYAAVTIGNQIEELIKSKYNLKNVITIFNPINLDEINIKINEGVDLDLDYIIAIGQYRDNIKQFDKLILSFANSILPERNIHLIILGNGNKDFLTQIAIDNNVLNFVHLLGFQENPFKYLKKSRFLVLSSKNEGFANVLVESLASQTPVVAFDCLCGPSTIIKHRENGLLVENQNIQKLTEALNLFVEDEELYNNCKQNALASIQKFSLDKIGKQWLDLMQIDKNNKEND